MTTRHHNTVITEQNIWAKNGDKIAPNDTSLGNVFNINDGWPQEFAEAQGAPVRREVINYALYLLYSMGYDVNRYGILPWHKDITYEVGAVAIGSDNKTYRAEVQNTDKDPVINKGTEWKLAQFAAINGSQGNITVTKDAKNNLTINTAVNLEDKANTTLDNVMIGDLLGKFQDTATVKWVSSNGKIQSTALTPDGTITTGKIADGNITTPKIANGHVTTAKIANANVSVAKLATDVINRFAALENKMNQLNRANRILSGFSNTSNLINFNIVTGATGCALIRVYGGRAPQGSVLGGSIVLSLTKNQSELRKVSARIMDVESKNSSAFPYFEYAVTGQAANTQVNGYNVAITGAGILICVGYSLIPY